ncbi:MAG: FecR domain-containing protein [Verrucomicrobia subdivision 3 bacterium]|nr:FecR domain-containing protein [Limisphaerales bacterium]
MKSTQNVTKTLVATAAGMLALSLGLQAQTQPGKAEVRAVKGTATYMVGGGPAQPLKVGTVLPSGSTIKTAAGSAVDLFLGTSAGVVRVAENTTLGLDKLTLTDTGADTVVEVQMNLPDGTILGNVNKLSAASKYEIKVPNGVAGIRGTRFRLSSTGYAVLLDGTMVFVYVPPGGNPTPYTLVGPPAVYFSPLEGVKPAPEDLVREVRGQFGPPFTPPGPPPRVPFNDPFVSPGVGSRPDVSNNPGQGGN